MVQCEELSLPSRDGGAQSVLGMPRPFSRATILVAICDPRFFRFGWGHHRDPSRSSLLAP